MTVWEVIRIISRDRNTRLACGVSLLCTFFMAVWLVPCLVKCRDGGSDTCILLFCMCPFIAAAVGIDCTAWMFFRDLVRYWRGVVRQHREEQYIL